MLADNRKKLAIVIGISGIGILLSMAILVFICMYSFLLAFSAAGREEMEDTYEMLQTTIEWGRLAPLPDAKSNFSIRAEGGFFTREFRCSFSLSAADLAKWVKASPGLQDAEIEAVDVHQKQYHIQPGGGAQIAEARLITVKMLWRYM